MTINLVDESYLEQLTSQEQPGWLREEVYPPIPDERWQLEGEGQWEPANDATARQIPLTPRPDFGPAAERRPIEEPAAFYGDEIYQHCPEVVLTLGSPTEIGMRAILDRAGGSVVPLDHGGLWQVKPAVKSAHIVYSDGQLCYYLPDRGYWRPVELDEIQDNIQEYDGLEYGQPNAANKRKIKTLGEGEIQSALRCGLRAVRRKGFFDASNLVPGLCLRDGFWHEREGDIVKVSHSPWHRARHGYDFEMPGITEMRAEGSWEDFCTIGPLDPWWEKPCPVWHWLLNSSLRDQAEDACFLQEFIAASLTGQATQYQRGAILIGPPGCGKSTIIQAITSIFPRGSVSSTDPATWREDYHRTGLIGMLLNTVNESQDWRSLGDLKKCVTGDPIEARFIGMNRQSYRPIAGQIYAANALSERADVALLDRWHLIEFSRRFRGDSDQVAEERILERIRRELPGFVLWVLHGWIRLARQKRYTGSRRSESLKLGWSQQANIVEMFVARCCRLETGLANPRRALFEGFVRWCDDLRIPERRRVDGLEFKRRINALGYPDKKVGPADKRVNCYAGLELVTMASSDAMKENG